MTSACADVSLPAVLDLPNAVALPIVLDEAGDWLGLGRITIAGVPVRSGRLPLSPEIRTPDGVQVTRLRPLGLVEVAGGGFDLTFAAGLRPGGPMEWMLHTVRNRQRIADWGQAADEFDGTRVTLELRPAERTVRGRRLLGFSYRYRFSSPGQRIYKILDRASWEIGGAIAGNTTWSRSAFCPSDHTFTGAPDERYSSEWYLPGIVNPNIFEFLPWQTNGQGFSFARHDRGCLVTWATGVSHIRSLFQKERGRDEFMHLHEHCGDLAGDVATTPIEVLFLAERLDRVDAINLYEGVRDLVWDALHAEAGLRRERVQSYAVVEEWGMPDFDRYRREALPALCAALPPKWVYVPSQFENNMNTWGVGNMCCTVDLKVSDAVGAERFAAFCTAVAAWGGQVEMWGNTSFSSLTYQFGLRETSRPPTSDRVRHLPWEGSVAEVARATPRFWLRNPAGHIEADHYAPVFCCANLREPAVIDYWHAAWRDLRERIGVSGIFLDSSFNLSSDKFHWEGEDRGVGGATPDQAQLHGQGRPEREPRAAILSQYHAHLALVRAMQGYGYRYSGEDIGLFGINRAGASCGSRVGRFHLWSESVCPFSAAESRAAGADPLTVFVSGLAYRQVWILYWDCVSGELAWTSHAPHNADERPTTEQLALIRAFDAVEADMIERTVLADGNVLYRNGDRWVLWTISAHELSFAEPVEARDVLAGTTARGATLPIPAARVTTWVGSRPRA